MNDVLTTITELDDSICRAYLASDEVAFDVETDTESYHWHSGSRGLSFPAEVTMVSLYAPDLPALVLRARPSNEPYDWIKLSLNGVEIERGYWWTWRFTDEQIGFISELFSAPKRFIAHNLVFDARQLYGKPFWKTTIHPQAQYWDTLTMAYTGASSVSNWESGAGLAEQVRSLMDESVWSWFSKMKPLRSMLTKLITSPIHRARTGVMEDDLIRYAALDSVAAYRLYRWQNEQPRFGSVAFSEKGVVLDSLDKLIEIDLAYTHLCVEMAARGIRFNTAYAYDQYQQHLDRYIEALHELGLRPDQESLTRSKAWQKQYIFSVIGGAPPEGLVQAFSLRTEKGEWSFSKKALAYYLEKYPQLARYDHCMRLAFKLRRLEEFIRHAEYDDRVHSVMARTAVTGRNTSSHPNIQNLQMKYRVKPYPGIPDLDCGLLIPDRDDLVFISLDASNAENWMAAMYSGDHAFANACAGQDFHTAMARAYFPGFDLQSPEEQRRLRAQSKTITFGTAYGMGVKKLARTLQITEEDADRFLQNKDRMFPKVSEAKKRWSHYAGEHGHVFLWTGRRVRMRRDGRGRVRAYAAWNALAQGGVGELIVRGMVALRGLEGMPTSFRVISQVHDEIILQIDPATMYPDGVRTIIQTLSSVIPESWNNRTTPACRWLFDLCNRSNADKWGKYPGRQYPITTDEYVNRWGVHRYESDKDKECPVWINAYGYGEEALALELRASVEVDHDPELSLREHVPMDFSWSALLEAFLKVSPFFQDMSYEGKVYTFPAAMELRRFLLHRGLSKDYRLFAESLLELGSVIHAWREKTYGTDS